MSEKERIVFEADVTDAQIEAAYKKDPRVLDHVNLESLGFGGGNSSDEDDGKSPFERLAVHMCDLTGDGGVLKKVLFFAVSYYGCMYSPLLICMKLQCRLLVPFFLPQNLKSGAGVVVPEKAFVKIHFDAYTEYSDEPVDSTYLRGKVRKSLIH